MGINDKKKKKKGLGRAPEAIPYTDDNMKHVAWCMNNSIVVGFSQIWASEDDWTIDIKINNKSSVDPNTYTGEEVMAKVYEYYKYYYDKYEKLILQRRLCFYLFLK